MSNTMTDQFKALLALKKGGKGGAFGAVGAGVIWLYMLFVDPELDTQTALAWTAGTGAGMSGAFEFLRNVVKRFRAINEERRIKNLKPLGFFHWVFDYWVSE